MTSSRRTATAVGLLFLTQTAAFIIAEQLVTGVLKAPDYLTGLPGHADALTLGAILRSSPAQRSWASQCSCSRC